MSTNYEYIPENVQVTETFRSKIELNDISTKLLSAIDISNVSRIAEIFSASGAFGIYAAKQNPSLHVDEYVSNVLDYEAISKNITLNAVKNEKAFPIISFMDSADKYDLAIIKTVLEKRKTLLIKTALRAAASLNNRSEERRVGKECRL